MVISFQRIRHPPDQVKSNIGEDRPGIRVNEGLPVDPANFSGGADEVNGLPVRSNGEIVVTVQVYNTINELCRMYEKALRGKRVVNVT